MNSTKTDGNILALRAAIFDERGKDKDVTCGIAPFLMCYNKNNLNVRVQFATRLSERDQHWAFELTKESMKDRYDASGYGWDDDDKMSELNEQGARFLLVFGNSDDGSGGGTNSSEGGRPQPVAFVHFRFSVLGEVLDKMAGDTCLYVYDLHLEESVRGRGLGKHLLLLLELIARMEQMRCVALPPMQLGDDCAREWLRKCNRGYGPELSLARLGFEADSEGFEVFSRTVDPSKATPRQAEPTAATATATAAATTIPTSTVTTTALTTAQTVVNKGTDVIALIESFTRAEQECVSGSVPADADWEFVSPPCPGSTTTASATTDSAEHSAPQTPAKTAASKIAETKADSPISVAVL